MHCNHAQKKATLEKLRLPGGDESLTFVILVRKRFDLKGDILSDVSTTLLMFTAWLQLDYRKILCNFCPLEFTRGPNGKCFNQEFALAFMGKCYK